MRPIAVINAIIFGSAGSIAFGLIAVSFIFLVLQGEHPRFTDELGPLLKSSMVFVLFAGVSGTSLYATLKQLTWRWIAQTAMWFSLACVVAYYWP
jgi:hypothetical protein